MKKIQRKERESHWYRLDGEPCHEVPYADPRKGMRPTIVTDARKLNLLPSVTNVLAVKDKPQLTTWKIDQAIFAALRLERKPGESEDSFLSRIAEEAENETRTAADFGTLIHEQFEAYNRNGAFPGKGEILEYVAGYEKWFRERVVEVIGIEEKVVDLSLGYAGRLDLHALIRRAPGSDDIRRAVIDFKSQRMKAKRNLTFYGDWQIQLSAYGNAKRNDDGTLPDLVSLALPSDAPGPLEEKWWDNGENAFKAFGHCHALWCYEKNYTPELP